MPGSTLAALYAFLRDLILDRSSGHRLAPDPENLSSDARLRRRGRRVHSRVTLDVHVAWHLRSACGSPREPGARDCGLVDEPYSGGAPMEQQPHQLMVASMRAKCKCRRRCGKHKNLISFAHCFTHDRLHTCPTSHEHPDPAPPNTSAWSLLPILHDRPRA